MRKDGRRIAKLRRDDATITKQKWMDEVAQADFRTDAEREKWAHFCQERKLRAFAFLLVEETVAGKHNDLIGGSASGGVRYRHKAGRICTKTQGRFCVPLFSLKLTMLSKMNCGGYISAGRSNATAGKVYSD